MAKKPVQLDNDEIARLSTVLREDILASQAATEGFRQNVQKWRRFLDDDSGDPPMFPGASELVSPFVKQSIFALMAELSPSLLDIVPVMHFEGRGQWKEAADALEEFYQELHTQHVGLKKWMWQFFYNGLRDGSAVAMVTWEKRRGLAIDHTYEESIMLDQMGQMVDASSQITHAPRETVIYDYPRIDIIDITRFGVMPAQCTDLKRASGVYSKHVVGADEILAGMVSGIYDKAAVAELLDRSPDVSDQVLPAGEMYGITPPLTGMPLSVSVIPLARWPSVSV